jgi:repressor LexA
MKDRERQVYEYIVSATEEKGYAPSVRDVMSALGFKSTSSVHMYIKRLSEKGMIAKTDGKSRAITLPEAARERGVPLIGRVSAGVPILAEQDFEGYAAFDASELACEKGDLFALRIKGESMINAGIFDGDTVIVERRDYAEDGEIVVALIEDEATVKRFFKENGAYRLQPENPAMMPIIVNSVRILGKVVASLRYYR